MEEQIGVITTFYGFRGNIVDKISLIVESFEDLDMKPYIQLNGAIPEVSYSTLVDVLKVLKRKHEITYSIHQSMFLPNNDFYLNLASSDEYVWKETIKSFNRSIDLANDIDAKNVSFHGGYAANKVYQTKELEPIVIEDPISFQEAYSNFRRGMNDVLDYAEGNVEVSVENLTYRHNSRHLFSLSEDFRYLTDRAKILFDVGHAYYSKKILNDNRYIDRIVEERRISEIHVSDNDGQSDAHQLIGFGMIPFTEVFKQLIKIQRLPPMVIEASNKKHNYRKADLTRCINDLKEIVSGVGKWNGIARR